MEQNNPLEMLEKAVPTFIHWLEPRRVHIVILVNILVQQPRRVQIVILVNILVRGLRLQTLLPDRI